MGGTTLALDQLNEGDCLHDFVGPLGEATHVEDLGRVAVLGGGLGCAIALMRLSKIKVLNWFSRLYITVIRGTPMLVQLYIVYFQLDFIKYPSGSIFGVDLERAIPCIIALSMNSAAYIAEIIRAGIQAVDAGQREASLSLGMTERAIMTKVIFPQAIKNILPALGNEVIVMIKQTSLASVFFFGELMTAYKQVQSTTFLALEPLTISGLIYLFLTVTLSRITRHFEKRMKQNER